MQERKRQQEKEQAEEQQRALEARRAAARAEREKKFAAKRINMNEQSLIMASFENASKDKPAILDMLQLKSVDDSEEREEGEL
jgi:hypothetical protein